MLLCRPILLIVLKTDLCVRACFFLGHPKILRIRVSWFRVGMGGDQIGCHKVSDMIAPRDHAYSELISERPGYFFPHYIHGSRCETIGSLVKHRWGWLDIRMLSFPIVLSYVVHTICPIWLIGLTVPFWPSRRDRKAFVGLGFYINGLMHCIVRWEVLLGRVRIQVTILLKNSAPDRPVGYGPSGGMRGLSGYVPGLSVIICEPSVAVCGRLNWVV
jgi:hypothetical protein